MLISILALKNIFKCMLLFRIIFQTKPPLKSGKIDFGCPHPHPWLGSTKKKLEIGLAQGLNVLFTFENGPFNAGPIRAGPL